MCVFFRFSEITQNEILIQIIEIQYTISNSAQSQNLYLNVMSELLLE